MRPHSWTCLPWPGAAPPLVVVAVGGAEVGKGSVAPGTQVAGVLQQHCTALGLGCRGEVTEIDHILHCNQYQTYKYFFVTRMESRSICKTARTSSSSVPTV